MLQLLWPGEPTSLIVDELPSFCYSLACRHQKPPRNSMLTHDFEDVVLCRYVYSRLRNRPPPKAASFDAFLRPGAKAAKMQRKCFPPKGLSSMLRLHVALTSFTFQPLLFTVLRNAIDSQAIRMPLECHAQEAMRWPVLCKCQVRTSLARLQTFQHS